MTRHQTALLVGYAITTLTLGLLVSGCATTSKPSPPACVIKTDTTEQAKSGNVEAQFDLGAWYMSSCGNYDSHKAAYWYEHAAENGHREAQFRIATMYYYSRGVAKDMNKSIRWYTKAAEQGEPAAARILGDISYRAKDLDQAEKWYRLASANGHTASQSRLEKIKKTKNPEVGKKNEEQVAKAPPKVYPKQKKKINPTTSGKLNAVGRVKEALKVLVSGPIVGAYIGTAGGYVPTYPGLVGGAAIGGVVGLVSGISVLVTGTRPGKDDSKSPYRSNKKKTMTAYLGNQVTPNDGLAGAWIGEVDKGTNWGRTMKLRLSRESEHSYSGRVLKFGGGAPDCKGAKVYLKRQKNYSYSIRLVYGSVCQAEGELVAAGSNLNGKVKFNGWMGRTTVSLNRLRLKPDQVTQSE